MPQGYSTRAGTKVPCATEKKLAKQPLEAPEEKFPIARAAAKISHTERKATFEATRGIRFIKDVHMYTGCPPDSGSKATRELTHRNSERRCQGHESRLALAQARGPLWRRWVGDEEGEGAGALYLASMEPKS